MSKITKKGNHIFVPDHVTIPYIEGDGVGHEITPVSQKIVNAAIKQAYNGTRSIEWKEVLAGEKAFKQTGSWLPDETMEAFREYIVGIKGPLTTPIGGGIRSLNVALRQTLDLYVCLRPVRWFKGVVSPVKEPQKVNMYIFRENTEDIYAGIEWQQGTPEAQKLLKFLTEEMGGLGVCERADCPDGNGSEENTFPGNFLVRHQAGFCGRYGASGACRYRIRDIASVTERDFGTQR